MTSFHHRSTVAILGAGSWGLAMALELRRQGHEVRVLGHNSQYVAGLIANHESSKLPGVRLPEDILFASDSARVISGADCVMFAVPAQVSADVARAVAPEISEHQLLIELSKGIERSTLRRMTEILDDEIPTAKRENICALSGPSHAEEVARCAPTSVVAASVSEETAVRVQNMFSSENFRIYSSKDVVGVELGGAVKNIIAIAAGVTQALGFGDNTLGALITRGLAEMSRLGEKLGADPLTFAGLSGLGDLVTTCFSKHSRNRRVGELLGQGKSLEEARESLGMVAEGVDTCVSVRDLARRLSVETPITEQVYRTLFERVDPRQALKQLMTRELKEEIWT